MLSVGLTAALLTSAGTPAAIAAVPFTDIASAGPLNHVYIGNELSCQVSHTGDASLELYPSGTIPGDCGTFLVVGPALFAPDFNNHGGSAADSIAAFTAFTPVSQSAVTGTGSAGDPFTVVTVVTAGESGITITETDSYVIGDEWYRTDIQLHNNGNASTDIRVYRAGDCYLGGSDQGFGFSDASTKAVACTANANNSPLGRIEEWTPITPADHFYEADFDDVWTVIGHHSNFPDTCVCDSQIDNGAGINWNRTLAAGGSVTLSHLTTFSPTGVTPEQPTATPPAARTAVPTPCIGGIVSSRCPGNPPEVKATVTPAATETELAAPSSTPLPPTVAPPQPTATPPGGGAAGVITGPNTGSGPGDAQTRLGWLLLAVAMLSGGAVLSTAALRARRR